MIVRQLEEEVAAEEHTFQKVPADAEREKWDVDMDFAEEEQQAVVAHKCQTILVCVLQQQVRQAEHIRFLEQQKHMVQRTHDDALQERLGGHCMDPGWDRQLRHKGG